MWYYNQNGQQFGPVNQTDFENMIRSGMISPQTPVWKDGMTDWKLAGQLSELSGFFTSNPPQYTNYGNGGSPSNNSYDKSTVSLVLGIVSCIAWFIPLIGVPISICGIVMGSKSLNSAGHGKAVAGLVLSIITLILAVINWFVGICMVM